jgi:hypothetical protein
MWSVCVQEIVDPARKCDNLNTTFIDAGVRTKGDTETSLRHDHMCGSKEDMVITGGVDFEAAMRSEERNSLTEECEK